MEPENPKFSEAIHAMESGRFEASFRIVESLALEGDPLARHFLGWHFHKGLGVPQSDAQAVHWWKLAAAEGIAESQQGLGWAYENGRGVEQDYLQAYRWYSRAVQAGDETARENLVDLSRKLTPEQIRQLEEVDS